MIDKLGLDGLGGASVRVEPAVVSLEPVAFMTRHDEPMLFPTWDEAVQYCDDDESPISLFHADDVAKLQAENEALKAQLAAMTQELDKFERSAKVLMVEKGNACIAWEQERANLAAMTKKADGFFDALQLAAKINAEGQAREQQLREALSAITGRTIALSQDDTALREWGANLLEEMAMEIDLGTQETEDAAITLCRKAEELRAGK